MPRAWRSADRGVAQRDPNGAEAPAGFAPAFYPTAGTGARADG
jgi:hypothetical protein